MHGYDRSAESFYGRYIIGYKGEADYEYAVYKLLDSCSSRRCFEEGEIRAFAPNNKGFLSEQSLGSFTDLAAIIKRPSWKGEIEKWLNQAG